MNKSINDGPRNRSGFTKYYVASKVVHAPLWKAMRSQGANIISTWIDEAGEGQTADYAELSERCIREVFDADVVVLYCQENEILKGALIEVGAALALGKPVRCVGDSPSISRVFKEHPRWHVHATPWSAFGSLPATGEVR